MNFIDGWIRKMTTNNVNKEYFEWLCSLIRDSKPNKRASYKLLIEYLYKTEFVYILPMDGNRCADGIDLRYRFGYEHGIVDPVIASCLDIRPCSILEMMVALCFRCEEHIMFNPSNGLMAGRWFWMMIKNLGLENMTDGNYDPERVNSIVWRFLDRRYSPDGEGGLVCIPDCQYDMRSMEIWYQMQRYLSYYRRNGD